MKKILVFLPFVCCAFNYTMAQIKETDSWDFKYNEFFSDKGRNEDKHLSFRNYPLGGNVDEFVKHYEKDEWDMAEPETDQDVPGIRVFTNTFLGERISMFAFYDVLTRNVTRLRVEVPYYGDNRVDDANKEIEGLELTYKAQYSPCYIVNQWYDYSYIIPTINIDKSPTIGNALGVIKFGILSVQDSIDVSLLCVEFIDHTDPYIWECFGSDNDKEYRFNKNDYGLRYLRRSPILCDMPAKCDGKDYRVVYKTYNRSDRGAREVNEILFVNPEGNSSADASAFLSAEKLIIHKLPNGNDFATVVGREYTDNDSKEIDRTHREIKIDDTTAQRIIDLLANWNAWKDKTIITYEIIQQE